MTPACPKLKKLPSLLMYMVSAMYRLMLAAAITLTAAPAYSYSCHYETPAGKTWKMVSKRTSISINGQPDVPCQVTASSSGMGYQRYDTVWRCGSFSVNVSKEGFQSIISKIGSRSAKTTLYTLTDKKGKKFLLVNSQSWDEKPNLVCHVDTTGRKLSKTLIDTVSDDVVLIKMTTQTEDVLVDKERPAI
jgi:hypothetical protein